MLIGTCNVIKNSTSGSSPHDDVAHLNLQRIALQEDRLFL